MKEKIRKDLQQAIREKKELHISTLRLIIAEIERKEKEKGEVVTEEIFYRLLQGMIRKRKEAKEQYLKAAREDLAQKEEKEIEIISSYLPKQMTEDEIRKEVKNVISEIKPSGPKDLGKLMGILMKRLSGKASGALVSSIAKEELSKLE